MFRPTRSASAAAARPTSPAGPPKSAASSRRNPRTPPKEQSARNAIRCPVGPRHAAPLPHASQLRAILLCAKMNVPAKPRRCSMKFGVVVFPGSNCDHDAFHAIGHVLGKPVEFIWHQSENLANCDAIILPGGFSYGDYLRTGAIARFSPVMKSVEKFATGGGLVLGICNGFQILCEAGLLPGAMMRNSGLR